MKRGNKIFSLLAKVSLLALFSTGLFFNCANPAAPQGGPRDTLPPKVVSMSPQMGKTNFKGKRIFIEFDEYIKLKEQHKEFYTSPKMKKNPLLLIRGRGVEITIQDTLKENTTYAFNFGSSIEDNNEGNKLHSFRYVMSTGEYIDSMVMSGYAEDAYKKDSATKAFVYFFPAEWDSIPEYDSVLFNSKPTVIGRAENNGIFIAQNLKPIDYRVYAMQDKNDNQEYEPGVDKVAFLEGTFNPTKMEGFEVWYDTTRNYLIAEPQLHFRMFKDEQFKRQYYVGADRPNSNKVVVRFGADYPQIDTLAFEGFDSTKILVEHLKPTKDSIALWFKAPVEEMPDTLRGFVTYMMHDTLNNLVPDTKDIAVVWKESKQEIQKREELEKERERAIKEGEEPEPLPNPFKVSVEMSKELNPERHIPFEFDYPLEKIDSAGILVVRTEGESKFRVRTSFVQDSVDIRRWLLKAAWQPAAEYELTIPDGVFTDVAGQQNDTLKANFAVMNPDEYGRLVFNVIPKEKGAQYVLQLLDEGDKLIEEKKHVTEGEYTFRYIAPGEVRLRVVEDMNKNGEWDEGRLVKRMQPERVEYFVTDSGDQEINVRANWELTFDIDMTELFEPVTREMLMDRLRREEEVRVRKYLEELEKNPPKKERDRGRESGTQFGGGFGGMGGMGGGTFR